MLVSILVGWIILGPIHASAQESGIRVRTIRVLATDPEVAVWPRPEGFFDFLFVLVLIWALVELGVMAGEPGANRFGPNPLKLAPA